ncbi:unnamed protein product [Parnassius apollo]|uniref:(apollo) hypothetical protein n=1 Tax=Parnassius apollo TaxID=110799 RepID=A0A8S3X8T6_PARAO|nr:unnamed protein product [Parnassius apollo]
MLFNTPVICCIVSIPTLSTFKDVAEALMKSLTRDSNPELATEVGVVEPLRNRRRIFNMLSYCVHHCKQKTDKKRTIEAADARRYCTINFIRFQK